MLSFLRNLRQRREERKFFAFSRPMVLLHSDDWGRVGVRDREGFDLLRSRGIRLGERPYDLYTLETAQDVAAVAGLLERHHDALGQSPCLMMHACTANLDFANMRSTGLREIKNLPLGAGLPGSWSRPGLFEAYRSGIAKGLLQPALHGTTHFCAEAVSEALAENSEQAQLLRTMWDAETPYIFWRMPWIGYEYWSAKGKRGFFLSLEQQRELVNQGCENFAGLFGVRPLSACAPGYRSNEDTHRAWSEAGIQVVVSGTGDGLMPPYMDALGILHLYRNLDFEPSQHEIDVQKYLELATICFARGIPLVISIHSINFHSTLKDFRTPTLAALHDLLTALESRFPELLYVSDTDLHKTVTSGALPHGSGKVKVSVREIMLNANIAEAPVS